MTDRTLPATLTQASGCGTNVSDFDAGADGTDCVHGRVRPIRPGEVLIEAGDQVVPFFVVGGRSGSRSSAIGHQRDAGRDPWSGSVHRRGQHAFGPPGARRRARASEPGEVIELDHERLLALVQTDSELSEILMRAFILRRVELIAHGLGDVVVVGSNHCSGTLRVKEFPDAQRPSVCLYRSRSGRRRSGIC